MPDLPEAKGFVASRDDGGAIGRLSSVENARGVARELSGFDHGGIFPDAKVVGPAVGGDDLLVVARPLEGADLSAGVDGVEASASGGVVEANGGISGASAGS